MALTDSGVERDGRSVVALWPSAAGAQIEARADLGPDELEHLAALCREAATNARLRKAADEADLHLKAVMAMPRERLTHRALARAVAIVTGVRVSELLGPRRNPPITKARHILVWLCKTYTSLSMTQIGERTGGRDHTAVIHGFGRVQIVRKRLGVTARADPVSWARALWALDWPAVSGVEARACPR